MRVLRCVGRMCEGLGCVICGRMLCVRVLDVCACVNGYVEMRV